MSMLDNLAQNQANDWLSEKLEDNPEQDEALQTTARIATAHIWPFLASAISPQDYQARRNIKRDEVLYICGTIAPHMASALTDHVLSSFDGDFVKQGAIHQAPGGGVHGPYYVREVGGGYDVVNAKGESKGHHSTREEALAQQRALYVHVPKAREQAESREGKAPPKAVQEVGEPGSEEQREHEGSLRVAQGDPYSSTTLLPNADQKDDKDDERPEPIRAAPHMPKPWENPKVDQEYEDPSGYYGIWGAGGQQMAKAAGLRVDRYGRITPVEPRPPVIAVLDRYGHIGLGAKVHYYPHPHPEAEDSDPDQEMSEAESRAPEHDVFLGHDEPHYEADWDRPEYGDWRGGVKERNPRTSAKEDEDDEDEEEAAAHGRHRRPTKEEEEEEKKKEKGEHHRKPPGSPRAGQSKPRPNAGRQTHRPGRPPQRHKTKTSAAKKPRPRAYSDMTPHAQLAHLIEDHPNPESWSWSMYPADDREDMHKRMHLIPEGADHSHQWPVGSRPDKEAHLVREESGYDPSEAFPGYYGTSQSFPDGSVVLGTVWTGSGTAEGYPAAQTASWTIKTPHTAQAPLTGNSDVPQDPESNTGASGGFDPGGALNVASPGGTVNTDFNQQDEPQDIQAQLGQVPTLGHKIGSKLIEMATEVLAHNPHLTAVAAMGLSLKALRLYPKVAAGGADYLAEPGTEGVPTEVLTDCPQCQRQAYNRSINRCHNCGFWDTGIEPTIEVT
jgi:hypothetical protein